MTGHQITAARVALGLTVHELAERVGVSRQSIWNWEARREQRAAPHKYSRAWSALAGFMATRYQEPTVKPADPIAAARVNETPAKPEPRLVERDGAGLLWPWLPTSGPEYRAYIRRAIEAA